MCNTECEPLEKHRNAYVNRVKKRQEKKTHGEIGEAA